MYESRIQVLVVEPGRIPQIETISNTLEALQSIVGGYIEAVCPFPDFAVLVCNEEGKLWGLPMNRKIDADSIVGTFLLTGSDDEGNFTSLTPEQIEQYITKFNTGAHTVHS